MSNALRGDEMPETVAGERWSLEPGRNAGALRAWSIVGDDERLRRASADVYGFCVDWQLEDGSSSSRETDTRVGR